MTKMHLVFVPMQPLKSLIKIKPFQCMQIPLMKPLVKGRRLRCLIAGDVPAVKFSTSRLQKGLGEFLQVFVTFVIPALHQTHLDFRFSYNDPLERGIQK